ncbi:MAG: carbamoyltransferase HypF [Candidatus Zixiibacteriota bacterium]
MTSVRIQIRGIVQGVGFRPFIYNLAQRCHLGGYVLNDTDGVEIEAEGEESDLDRFIVQMETNPPPQARIEQIEVKTIPFRNHQSFLIKESETKETKTGLVSPDLATCDDCVSELFDPQDRRFGYPFLNCTNCGPRLTIIQDVPYDRDKTTMSEFSMCPDCKQEYDDPQNRRFHAQPNACPVCGPKLGLSDKDGTQIEVPDSVIQTIRFLKEGFVVAIKGLGGYHLSCDAGNPEAVSTLRKRKYREDKPFALMAANVSTIERFCHLNSLEKKLLESVQRPILLLRKKNSNLVAPDVAPHQKNWGVMLPYTPLHHLLLKKSGLVLVMTSANLSDEPIAYEDGEAFDRLAGIADYFLRHNRNIHRRCDDSVTRAWNGKELILRRARGYVPRPIKLQHSFKKHILACGAELKNTFCLGRGNYAFLGTHIGDLENLETLKFFEQEIERFANICHVQPEVVAFDLHPQYLSTQFALSSAYGKKIPVQHHHAHIVSCMAENQIKHQVIGVAFDGTGYGEDGSVWGGEFLLSTLSDYRRVAHLKYIPMLGGEKAIKQPWRMALSYLYACFGDGFRDLDIDLVRKIDLDKWNILKKTLTQNLNVFQTSSVGRLFDAVSVLLNYRFQANYEGQPAIELEMMADQDCKGGYDFSMLSDSGKIIIDPGPMIKGIVQDLIRGESKSKIAGRFHNTIARIVNEVCNNLRKEYGREDVCLSGGVFQNVLLLDKTYDVLTKNGFKVHTHSQVPPNDGGISLGQAVIASQRI